MTTREMTDPTSPLVIHAARHRPMTTPDKNEKSNLPAEYNRCVSLSLFPANIRGSGYARVSGPSHSGLIRFTDSSLSSWSAPDRKLLAVDDIRTLASSIQLSRAPRCSDILLDPSDRRDQFFIPKRLLHTGEMTGGRRANVSPETFVQRVAFLQTHQDDRQRFTVRPNEVQ